MITDIGAVSHTTETAEAINGLPVWKRYDLHNVMVGGSGSSEWTYGRDGRLASIPGYITGILYEPDGQTDQITYANGVTTDFSYDPERRWLERTVMKKSNNTVLLDNTYARDVLVRITAINGQANKEMA